jgi:hypothetical protein
LDVVYRDVGHSRLDVVVVVVAGGTSSGVTVLAFLPEVRTPLASVSIPNLCSWTGISEGMQKKNKGASSSHSKSTSIE